MGRWLLPVALLLGLTCVAHADVFNMPPAFLRPIVAPPSVPVAGSNSMLVNTGVVLLVDTGVKLLVQ